MVGLCQHRLQQDITAGRDVFLARVFNLVVADPIFARDKNHAGGADLRQILGVVSRAADHLHGRESQRG